MLSHDVTLCCCSDNLYGVLDWQRVGARRMIQHYLNAEIILQVITLKRCSSCVERFLDTCGMALTNACMEYTNTKRTV